jgi:signal peptidase I
VPGAPDHEMLKLTRPEVCGLFEDLLSRGAAVRVRVTGQSMEPFLHGGEVLTIKPLAGGVAAGDVVFFRRNDVDDPAIHRVVRILRDPEGRTLVQTQGDALNTADEPVEIRSVLGKVSVVERTNAALLDLESWPWHVGGRLKVWRMRVRSMALDAYARVRGVASMR